MTDQGSTTKTSEHQAASGSGHRTAALFVSSSMIAVAALYLRTELHPLRTQLLEYVFIIFASLAAISLYIVFPAKWQVRRVLNARGAIFLASVLILVSVFSLGMHQFGGFDEGLVVHAGAFYAHDFRPYLDFHCTMPPLFMASIRCAVKLLGLRWASLILLPALFAATTALWIFHLLRLSAVERSWALIITVPVELSTMVVIPFWWYNNSSSVAVVLLLLSVVACLKEQPSLLPWFSLAASLGMVLTSKPNALPACLMVLLIGMTRDKGRLRRLLFSVTAAICIAAAICYLAQMPLTGIIRSYVEIAKLRGAPFKLLRDMTGPEKAFQILFILESTYCFAVLLRLAFRRSPSSWRILGACAVSAITSLGFASTNSEFKVCDLVSLFMAAILLCLCPWEQKNDTHTRKIVLVGWLAVFTCMAGFYSVTHRRILAIGSQMFYEPLPTRKVQKGFFTGLDAGPRLQRVLWQTQQVLMIFPNAKVFFGPRMEFNYAVFDKPPLPGMPLLWDTGNLFPESRLPQFISAFRKNDPDVLIFLKDDFTRMNEMETYILHSENYVFSEDFADITVFIKKKTPPVQTR